MLLAARYRLVTMLEAGGMAEIWQADDELLGRPVAVKLPHGSQVVRREARMAARLSHPNIAAVHDYREAVRPDGTVAPFVVMELLAGESVAARLDREPIGLPEAARIGAAVADALAAAHANAVVHRDIKPGNVMLTPTGVKILDFGISATAGEPDDDDTGSTFGTPAYAAPERLDGMPAEPATDVYGLGVLLFEMVTGDPPFPVDSWEELAAARASGPQVLPDDLPCAFRDLVTRCLADSPADRPGAEEIRFDLTALWLKPTFEAPPASILSAPLPSPNGSPRPAEPPEPSGSPSPAAPPRPAVPSGPATPSGPVGPGRRTGASTAGRPAENGGRVRSTAEEPRAGAEHPAYATGRAAPATLALTPPPTRRWVLGVTVVALLAAIGGAVIAVNWPRGSPQAIPEPLPPAIVSSSPAPSTSPANAPSFSSTPKVLPSLRLDDAVNRFRSAVEDGAADGTIRSDVATDFLNLLRPLAFADAGPDEVVRQVDSLRRKLDERIDEGGVKPEHVAVLRTRLADLDRAAGI